MQKIKTVNGIQYLLVYRGHILGHEWQEIDVHGKIKYNGGRHSA